jgi:hypothetical protein
MSIRKRNRLHRLLSELKNFSGQIIYLRDNYNKE